GRRVLAVTVGAQYKAALPSFGQHGKRPSVEADGDLIAGTAQDHAIIGLTQQVGDVALSGQSTRPTSDGYGFETVGVILGRRFAVGGVFLGHATSRQHGIRDFEGSGTKG